jgi:hypothetical protein
VDGVGKPQVDVLHGTSLGLCWWSPLGGTLKRIRFPWQTSKQQPSRLWWVSITDIDRRPQKPPRRSLGSQITTGARKARKALAGVPKRSWWPAATRLAVNLVGVAVLVVVAGLFWNSSFYEHAAAITDPARLQQQLTPGDIAVIFNQPVQGTLDTSLDFRTHGAGITISGTLLRKPKGTQPLRWAVFSYGSLKLSPKINLEISGPPPPVNLSGVPFRCQHGHVRAGLVGVKVKFCSKAGLNSVELGNNPLAVNYDPCCPFYKTTAASLTRLLNCMWQQQDNPRAIPGPLALHTGSARLGNSPLVSFYLQGGAAGPFLGQGGGRVEGVTGVVGGTDTLVTIFASISSPKDIPVVSRKAIGAAMKTFTPATTKLGASETVVTDWTDSSGHLGQGVDLLSSSQPMVNPHQLSFSWKAGQAPGNAWWELENRLSVENAQSQDFFAGVWAAVAATAALMALALLGKTVRDLIFRGNSGD